MVKRRMVRARIPQGAAMRPGQDLHDAAGQAGGTVLNVAGDEMLAVVSDGNALGLEVLPLPYPA